MGTENDREKGSSRYYLLLELKWKIYFENVNKNQIKISDRLVLGCKKVTVISIFSVL